MKYANPNSARLSCRGLILILFFFTSLQAVAENLKVMISGGFSAAYKVLGPQFEKADGVHLETVTGPSMGTTPGAIPVRLARGESGDVVIMARSALDALAQKGQVVEGSQVDLARSRIGMAVRAGVPSASGVYISSELFKRLGIQKEMAGKSRQIPAEPVGLVVARGEAEIGFQQMSELAPIPGITVVGAIPEELQSITVFSAGIVAKTSAQEAARALIRYLGSPAACPAIQKSALEPVACVLIKGRRQR